MPIATPLMEDATAQNMTAAQIPAAAQAAAASAGAAAQYAPTTSAEQLSGILNKGGPLMQQAATTGNQQAASRGLLNSSMGIQAAQNAVIANAAPLAQADANSINTAGQFNTGATNQMNQFNTGNQQQTNLANQQATNAVNNANAGFTQQASAQNQQQQNAMAQWNAGQQNEATLKSMDVNSREQLAAIESQYKREMQTSSSASGLFEQVMKNVSDIQNNKDVTDKQGAIDSQLAWLRSGMTMISNLSGIQNLVTF